MAGARDSAVPPGHFQAGGLLATGQSWRQGTIPAPPPQQAVTLEQFDPVGNIWVSTGIEVTVSSPQIGIPFEVDIDGEVHVITLRTASEGIAAVGAEEYDVRLSPVDSAGSVAAPGSSAASGSAAAEGGTTRRVWTPGRSAGDTNQADTMPSVPRFPQHLSQEGAETLLPTGPFQGLSAALRQAVPSSAGAQSVDVDLPASQASVAGSPSQPRPAQLRRVSDGGAAVPGSQDSQLAAGLDDLRLTDPAPALPTDVSGQRASTRRRKRPTNSATPAPALQDSGWLRCSFCPDQTAFLARTTGGLLSHISRAHQGAVMTLQQAQHLAYLGKVCCVQCGSLRDHKSRTCSWCVGCTRCRQVKAGDTVLDRERQRAQGNAASQPDAANGSASASASPNATDATAGRSGDGPAMVDDDTADSSQEAMSGPCVPTRRVVLPTNLDGLMRPVYRKGLKRIPMASAGRCATAWAECLEGSMAGSAVWGKLAEYRTRLLFGGYAPDCDNPDELKARLKLWEHGKIDELAARASSSALRAAELRQGPAQVIDELKQGDIARAKACDDALRKAIQGFVSSGVDPTPEQRVAWAELFLPEGSAEQMADARELRCAQSCAWGKGDAKAAKRDMLQWCKDIRDEKSLPWASFPSCVQPGPTGDTYEHLLDCLACSEFGPRKRLRKALEQLTVLWMVGGLPDSARWMLDTYLFWASKEKQGVDLEDEDSAWLIEADAASEEPSDCPPTNEPGNAGDPPTAAMSDETSGGRERPKVRPIQMGEMLRKFVCKRGLALERTEVLQLMTAMRQYGCGSPGGTEVIIHIKKHLQSLWRKQLLLTPLATIDVDQRNFFGSLNWRTIREEVAEELPRRAASTTWKHLAGAKIHQPDVAPHTMSHGTGQGDVDAAVEASLVQGRVAREARGHVHAEQRAGRLPWICEAEKVCQAESDFDDRLRRSAAWRAKSPSARRNAGPDGGRLMNPRNEIQAHGGIVDSFYLDDGTIICAPQLVVPYMTRFQHVDKHEAGSELNQDKSRVRLFATASEFEESKEVWQVDRMRALAAMDEPDASTVTLGAEVGNEADMNSQMEQKSRVVDQMARRIQSCQDPQVELSLTRACLGVSKVNHLLRANGTELMQQEHGLDNFDEVQAHSLRRLVPGLGELGEQQACRALGFGGLGIRKARSSALPAHLASLIAAEPKVADLAEDLERAGLVPAELIMAEHRLAIATARRLFEEQLDSEARSAVDQLLTASQARARSDWSHIKQGKSISRVQAPRGAESRPSAAMPAELARAVSGGLRDEPDEMGQTMPAFAMSTAHLQRELTYILEAQEHEDFVKRVAAEDDRSHRRIVELQSVGVSHSWIWILNPRNGSRLSAEDFTLAMQSRLGAVVSPGDDLCRQCGEALDPKVSHAFCCAKAESTRGHYKVVSAVAEGLALVDPCLQTEVRGLASTTDRPADILTTAAIPGRTTALDITVASPDAVHAGLDACASAYARKVTRYSNIIPQLSRAGITFQPMVWSTEGRPHPATTRVLEFALKAAARKHGADQVARLRSRWLHEIGIELQRRKAAMMRACLPARGARQTWLLAGILQNATAADVPGHKAGMKPALHIDAGEERWMAD